MPLGGTVQLTGEVDIGAKDETVDSITLRVHSTQADLAGTPDFTVKVSLDPDV